MLSSPVIPIVFVFLWSTGFIGSKLGMPYAEPATFLLLRMIIAAILLVLLIPFVKGNWPTRPIDYFHSAVVGILIHGIYLGGVFQSIYLGVDASLSALIVCLQPLLTVVLSSLWLKEKITGQKIIGVGVGFIGVTLVIAQSGTPLGQLSTGLLFCFLALIGITVGTIYQKRYCTTVDLLPGVAIQYFGNILFLAPLAFWFESMHINWTPTFAFALSWLVLVLSLGAVLMLMLLIERGEAGKVASLFYLVPPLVAIEAWFLFEERLSPFAWAGVVLSVIGVMLVMKSGGQEPADNHDKTLG